MKKQSFDTEEKALSIAIGICLLFLLGLMLTGCAIKKETYLIVLEPEQAYVNPVCEKETIYVNRFERQFHQADSTFMSKLRESSKQAAKEASKQIYSRK